MVTSSASSTPVQSMEIIFPSRSSSSTQPVSISSCIVLHIHVLLKSCRSLCRSIYDFGFHLPRTPALNFPKKTNNPNPSPIGNKFGLFLFGPSGENRTHGLLNPIVLLSKTQCTIRYCLDSVSLNFKCIISFCFIFQLGYTPVVSDMKKIVQKTVALSFPTWTLAVWDMDAATLYMVKYDRSH